MTTTQKILVQRSTFGRRLAALLEQARTQRTGPSDLARQIAAYPAARGVATVILPLPH